MGFQGYPFTWHRGTLNSNRIEERLDRFCVNRPWKSLFPSHKVWYLSFYTLDHSPILLDCSSPHSASLKQPLKRFESWSLEEQEIFSKVEHIWTQHVRLGGIQPSIFANLVSVLHSWAKGLRLNFKRQLISLDKHISESFDQGDLSTYLLLIEDYNRILHEQELYWLQCSRLQWLQAGDRNTKIFHRKASARHSTNSIDGLLNEHGIWCNFPSHILQILHNYFCSLFSAEPVFFECWLNFPSRTVPSTSINELIAIPSEDENFHSILEMGPWKAPGPNGMPAIFFKKF